MEKLSSSNEDKKSKKSSSLSLTKKSVSQKKNDNHTEDAISMTQLEIMANKAKVNKVEDNISQKNDNVSIVIEAKSEKSKKSNSRKKKSTSSSSFSSSESTDVTYLKKKRERQINKENNNDTIRNEKLDLLCRYNSITGNEKSSTKLDLNNTLDEIKNEISRITNTRQQDKSVNFIKRMMVLGFQGIEMMNTRYDPLGVDLEGWSEAMGYNMNDTQYDEVLTELYIKYKGSGQMSPELKLIFLLMTSTASFVLMKKLGSELKQTFGNPLFRERSNKYYVERKSEIMQQINPFAI